MIDGVSTYRHHKFLSADSRPYWNVHPLPSPFLTHNNHERLVLELSEAQSIQFGFVQFGSRSTMPLASVLIAQTTT